MCSPFLLRQRVRPQLEVPETTFLQPRCTVAARYPQPAALPTGIRVVDPAVQAFVVETEGIRNAHRDELTIDEHVNARFFLQISHSKTPT